MMKMSKLTTIVIAALMTLLVFPAFLIADEGDDGSVAWLGQNAVKVRSIDPEDADFQDLMPLVDLIRDARVVGLGEPSHGDGATFQAKARLARFLHEVMGFDLLVWESGLFDCMKADEALRQGEDDAFSKGIFSIWTECDQMRPLFDYIAISYRTGNPLQVAGMDCQMMSNTSAEEILQRVHGFFDRFHPAMIRQETMDAFDAGVKAMLEDNLKTEVHEAFQNSAKNIIETLSSKDERLLRQSNDRERSLLRRLVANLAAGIKMGYCYKQAALGIDPRENQLEAALIREPVLADNVIWLARERFPDRKIMVWAANSHLLYNSRSIELKNREGEWAPDTHPWLPMGNPVRENLQDDYYVVQFIAFEGDHAMINQEKASKLDPAPAGSFDALCEAVGGEYLFLDLASLAQGESGAWLNERRVARPRRYMPARAAWPEVCDAFFFTRTMFRATSEVPPPEEGRE